MGLASVGWETSSGTGHARVPWCTADPSWGKALLSDAKLVAEILLE